MIDSDKLKQLIKRLVFENIVDSQSDFAKQLGYERSTISGMVNGKKPITDSFANKVSETFNVNIDWLRMEQGEMFKDSQKIGDIRGSNNTAVAGNGNHVNSETDKFLDLLKTQNEIIQKNSEMLQKRDAQIDELIALLKK